MAHYVSDPLYLPTVVDKLMQRPRVSLDLETTGLDPLKDEILLVGIDEYAILGTQDLSPLKPLIESNAIPKIIFNAAFDGMFLQRRGMLPYRVFDPMLGAMLLKCGLHSPDGTFKLENLLKTCLGVTAPANKYDMQMSFVGVDPKLFIPSLEQIRYVCSDTEYLGRLCDWVQDHCEQMGLMSVWRIENAVTQVVAQMQIQGIPLNKAAYTQAIEGWEQDYDKVEADLSGALTPAIMEVRRRKADEVGETFNDWLALHDSMWKLWEQEYDTIYPTATRKERRAELQAQDRLWRASGNPRPARPKVSPDPINLGSVPQVKAALGELGVSLPDKKRSSILRAKVGQGVEMQAVLNQLAQWSKLDKQLGTYGRAMLDSLDADLRLRCRFTQITSAGRRASSKFHDDARGTSKGANLQNFPPASRVFVQPPKGRKFVIGDYSQIELRIAAEFALQRNPQTQDALVRAFRDGTDPHVEMAAVAYGQDYGDLFDRYKAKDPKATKLRAAGKTANFSALFGIAAGTLAVRIYDTHLADDPNYVEPLTEEDVNAAKNLLSAFWELNPTIKACLNDWRKQALYSGYTTTMSGRRRYFPTLARSDPEYQYRRGQTEREAGNQPIQGTAADISKLAEVLIQRAFYASREDAVLINSVHDEVMVEAASRRAYRAKVVVEHHMKAAYKNWIKIVPCAIEVGVQTSWQH